MENVSVIGIGKLGLCFALTLEKSGYNVVGVDISQQYVDLVNKKELKSSEQGVEEHL
jgi:UDP-N-acetyl-D-mannosaminuronate dehydrogenase